MIEKVNPSHVDKIADRIAGAIVDLAYKKNKEPKVAVEVLIGHGTCYVIIETTVKFTKKSIYKIIDRIAGKVRKEVTIVPQDKKLENNQNDTVRCGDNGIFRGVPLTEEQRELSKIARSIYDKYESDGKYILADNKLIICQSNAQREELLKEYPNAHINPLGNWTGGIDVDTGATNRKLGSDMADAVTGGGLHGKDLSKADVTLNIYAFLIAQVTNEPVEFSCAIGDEFVKGIPYSELVRIAGEYVDAIGGFEKLAEWGLF